MSSEEASNGHRRTGDRSSIIPWERDCNHAQNSNENHACSAEILLRWLTTGQNFAMYRGDTTGGVQKKSKSTVLHEVVQYFKDNGIPYRKDKNIRSRIDRMTNTYREAMEWHTRYNEGRVERSFYARLEGKTEEQKEHMVQAQMLKICREYDRIHPFLMNATWTSPLTPSKGKRKIDHIDSEESEEELVTETPLPETLFPNNTFSLGQLPTTTTYRRIAMLPVEPQVPIEAPPPPPPPPPPPKRPRTSEDELALTRETELQQLTQLVTETENRRVEMKLMEEKATLERESMITDIMIKKNKAALESLKFMHEEGLITKDEYREKCTKIFEVYSGFQ